MSKKGYIQRHLLILKKLRTSPFCTYEELRRYLSHQFEYHQLLDNDLSVGFSKRTLQRDFREIRDIYGVDIEYSRSRKGYFISYDPGSYSFHRKLEAFDILSSLELADDLKPYVLLERRGSVGTENLYGILHAIKKQLQIQFLYQKFWEGSKSVRIVEPVAVKEFKNRWYVIARDTSDNHIKHFGLDRISQLEVTKTGLTGPIRFNADDFFQYSFGITTLSGEKPERIELSFNKLQGAYIKSVPLHHTQEVLVDNETEIRIQLKCYLTQELIMEILSHGSNVKVLAPRKLIDIITDELKAAHNKYYK